MPVGLRKPCPDSGLAGRILGLQMFGGVDWLGGINYLKSQIGALRLVPEGERPRVFLCINQRRMDAIDLLAPVFPLLDGFALIGERACTLELDDGKETLRLADMDALLSAVDWYYYVAAGFHDHHRAIPWIPDLQHTRMPEMFTPESIADRDRDFRTVAERGRRVVFSCRLAAADFLAAYPGGKAQPEVVPFTFLPDDSLFAADPGPVIRRYGLPPRYLMCCNQFWKHKDHGTLLKALGLLKERGHTLALACTGHRHDYRWPHYFAELTDLIAALGLAGQVTILGTIDREHQLQLLRGAAAVVQPSRFEGWSTVVEDCRSLGKRLFLSDIDVHREQHPPGARFFRTGDPEDLARLIEAALPELAPGPDFDAEAKGRRHAREFGLGVGRAFCRVLERSLAAPGPLDGSAS